MNEFGLLQSKGIVAFTDGVKTIQNPRLMSRIMNSAKDLGCLIMQHAEDYELAKNGMINSGIIATKLGLPGIPEIAERILIERDLTLLEKVKCRYHISGAPRRGPVRGHARLPRAGTRAVVDMGRKIIALRNSSPRRPAVLLRGVARGVGY